MNLSTSILILSTIFTLLVSTSANSTTQEPTLQTNNLVKAGNKYVTLLGEQVNVGEKAPNFNVVNENFSEGSLNDFDKKII
ncbi:MAG: thiol peroxidase, partial [Alteromonadaceae bacterium]|nr:thiol peroxidase [Alteromonadaceae bacterium]